MPKRVKPGAAPKAAKQPKIVERPNLYQRTPSWSFLKCDTQHERWGIFKNTEYKNDSVSQDSVYHSVRQRGGTESILPNLSH